MSEKMSVPLKLFILFCYGGCLYTIIELLFRGNSHWSMFILGGVCFLVIGGLNQVFPEMSLLMQMTLSAFIITALEFLCGVIVNLWLCMNVWNYESMPFNIMGQICPIFTVAWFFLSLVGIVADDFLRLKLFEEKFPKYRII